MEEEQITYSHSVILVVGTSCVALPPSMFQSLTNMFIHLLFFFIPQILKQLTVMNMSMQTIRKKENIEGVESNVRQKISKQQNSTGC